MEIKFKVSLESLNNNGNEIGGFGIMAIVLILYVTIVITSFSCEDPLAPKTLRTPGLNIQGWDVPLFAINAVCFLYLEGNVSGNSVCIFSVQ